MCRTRRIRDTDGTWKPPKEGKSKTSQPAPAASTAAMGGDGGPYIKRINNDAREDEMEENMQAVGSILGNLKSMAQDMGSEIETQNKQIDRIGAKVNNNDDYRYIYQLSLIIIILLTLQSVHIDK